MEEFVGLRAKMYSFKVAGAGAKKTAKGIKTTTVNTQIKFEDYKQSLL